jgi:toxin ParE1/3/4
MSRVFLIRPQAEADLAEAYRWYEGQREGLGADFALCIEETLDKIRRSPEIYPKVYRHLRRAFVRRFPYGVFYVMREETIAILGVLHGSRDPKRWRSLAEE